MKFELRSVRIKNCGPIDDLKIEFFDNAGKTLPVCVIGGANGSGKTTVLEVIFSLVDLLGASGVPRFLKVQSHNRTDFYAELDCRINEEPLRIAAYDNTLRETVPDGYIALTTREIVREGRDVAALRKKIFDQQRNGFTPNIPNLIYLPHSRSLESIAGEQINKEQIDYSFAHRVETVREFRGSLNSYLIWLEYAKPDLFTQTQRFLNDLNFDGKTFHINRETLDVIVRTSNGQDHRLHELSSGEQNLLIILIELRRRLLPGGVVLIDEIENSLHPAFQHRLAQGLLALQKEVPYQLIVTTHAPAFVEIFGAENTRILTDF